MGWTFFESRGRSTLDLLKERIESDGPKGSMHLIDHSIRGGTAYLLCEWRPKGEWAPCNSHVNDPDGAYRFIAVFLVKRNARARDGYDFGYKDMDESMGPCERDCPKRLIDKASPLRPDYTGYARKWREDCLARLEQRRKTKTDLPPGTRIKFARPIKFKTGAELDEFEVVVVKRRGRNMRLFTTGDGGYYRIHGLHQREFTIIDGSASP